VTNLAEGARHGWLGLGDLRPAGDGVSVGGPGLLLDRRRLSVRWWCVSQSINASPTGTEPSPQMHNAVPDGG
jgi:hypothetical protein